jgi:hypothetical protein
VGAFVFPWAQPQNKGYARKAKTQPYCGSISVSSLFHTTPSLIQHFMHTKTVNLKTEDLKPRIQLFDAARRLLSTQQIQSQHSTRSAIHKRSKENYK